MNDEDNKSVGSICSNMEQTNNDISDSLGNLDSWGNDSDSDSICEPRNMFFFTHVTYEPNDEPEFPIELCVGDIVKVLFCRSEEQYSPCLQCLVVVYDST